MGILSKLKGTAEQTTARSARGRSTTGKGAGGGRARVGRGRAQPASAGGLSKLIGSFKRR